MVGTRVVTLLFWVVLAGFASAQSPADTDSSDTSNNRRHGFIIGFGIGPGYTHLAQDGRIGPSSFGSGTFDEDGGKFAVNSDFKIGFAVDEQTLVYFNTKAAWFQARFSEVVWHGTSGSFETVWNNEISVNAISGISLCYCTKPTLPSSYVSGTLGFATLGTSLKKENVVKGGFGAAISVGYEFAPHWTLDVAATYCHISDSPLNTNIIAVKAQIGVLSF